ARWSFAKACSSAAHHRIGSCRCLPGSAGNSMVALDSAATVPSRSTAAIRTPDVPTSMPNATSNFRLLPLASLRRPQLPASQAQTQGTNDRKTWPSSPKQLQNQGFQLINDDSMKG